MTTLANDVQARLAADLLDTDTSLLIDEAVAPMNNPPEPPQGESAVLTLVDQLAEPTQIEIVTYTTVTDNQDGTWTIGGLTRGQEGTAAQPFNSGAWVFQAATASLLASFLRGPFDNALHGDRGGGTLHAEATDSLPGFMSAADKAKLDGLELEFHRSADATLWWLEALADFFAVTGIGPNTGDEAGGTEVTITGDFRVGEAATVAFDTEPATGVTVENSTTIKATTPAGTGTVDVTVEQGVDSATLTNAFTFGVLWTLADIVTALLLDSADGSTITLDGSNNIEQWNDKSGNLRHFSQGTAGARPNRVIDGVKFLATDNTSATGSTRLSRSGTILQGPPYHVFTVIDEVDTSLFEGSVIASNSADKKYAQCRAGLIQSRNESAVASVPFSPAPDWADGARNLLYGAWLSSTDRQARINGGAAAASTENAADIGTTGATLVGNRREPSATWFSQPLTATVRQCVIIHGALSTEDRQRVEGRLSHKWDEILGDSQLVDALPADHPHKLGPPLKD